MTFTATPFDSHTVAVAARRLAIPEAMRCILAGRRDDAVELLLASSEKCARMYNPRRGRHRAPESAGSSGVSS